MDLGLRDAVALVTGASGAIGAGVARQLAGEGARLVLHAHAHGAAAERLAEELPTDCLVLTADLRDEAAVAGMFERLLERFGRCDALVANAGVSLAHGESVRDLSLETFEADLALNLRGTFLCLREFFRLVERQHAGRAVLIGSTAGRFGEAGNAGYAASKAALQGLMLSLKNELTRVAPYAAVNLVGPGWVVTPMMHGVSADEVLSSFQTRAIAAGVPRPEDVAPLVAFLCSDRCARFVCGQSVYVDGGMEGRVVHAPEELAALRREIEKLGR